MDPFIVFSLFFVMSKLAFFMKIPSMSLVVKLMNFAQVPSEVVREFLVRFLVVPGEELVLVVQVLLDPIFFVINNLIVV